MKIKLQRKSVILSLLILLALMLTSPVFAEQTQAEYIKPSLSGVSSADKLLDGKYSTSVRFAAGSELTISSNTPMQGIYIEWNALPYNWTLSAGTAAEGWESKGFLHEYVPFASPETSVTLHFTDESSMAGIKAVGVGELPDDLQVWRDLCEKADFLVFSTHADDELLFLGGVLAEYAGEEDLAVQIAYMTQFWTTTPVREHEKLDGLWAIGVENYPVNGKFDDVYADSLESAKKVYKYDEVLSWVTETARRFKPLVVVTQDLKGEYGHGGHMILASAVCEMADHCGEADFLPETAKGGEIRAIPKTYLHLYPENQINMDLRKPLSKFGGKNAVEAAGDAYKKHLSQQWCWFYVTDDPNDKNASKINAAVFGLYKSTVGPDTGNDMMEHLVSWAEQERIEAERAAEQKAREEAYLEYLKKMEDEELRLLQEKTKRRNKLLTICAAAALAGVIACFAFAKSKKKGKH